MLKITNCNMQDKDVTEGDRTYPYIAKGQETGMIVLFTAPKTGTILSGTDDNRTHQVPGYTSKLWAKEDTNWIPLPKGQKVNATFANA